jgi:hypothetical protein
VEGAVWAAAASPESGRFAIGTGKKYCYVYTFTQRRQRYRRWKLPGVPCSAEFSTDGQTLIVGTWQDAGVGRFSLDGRRLAWQEGRADRLYSAHLSLGGDCALAVATPNSSTPGAVISLKNGNLDDLWQKELPFCNVTADIDAGGTRVAVGYQRIIAHKDEEMREDRITIYDRRGNLLWEKGGAFGKWKLLQVCASGRVLLHDESSIYLLDPAGTIKLRRKLPSSIRLSARDPLRRRIALYCGDGQLCIFSIE